MLFRTAAIAAVALVAANSVLAQSTFPNKPLKLIVTYPPGGSSDLMSRAFAIEFGQALGQQVIIESKPGAAGSIGIDYAAKQAPDGYTMVVGNMQPVSVNPMLTKVPYDMNRDLAPVSMLSTGPNVLVVQASHPAKTLQELLAMMKAKPNSYNYGNSGPGALNHLAGEQLKRTAGVDMQSVSYKGGVLALQDLLGGAVQVVISDALPAMAHIRSGKLRPLAVTSETRTALVPGVPTFTEAGVPGMVADNWWGIYVPAATPKAIIDRLNADMIKTLQSPTVKEKFNMLGIEPVSSTPERLREFAQAETARWGKLIKEANIKAE
jgi:tripartite-type tricarboxylate transporter receptor subunit TctC